MTVYPVLYGGVYNPDGIGLHLRNCHVDKVKGTLLAGRGRNCRIHGIGLKIVTERNTYKYKVSVTECGLPGVAAAYRK